MPSSVLSRAPGFFPAASFLQAFAEQLTEDRSQPELESFLVWLTELEAFQFGYPVLETGRLRIRLRREPFSSVQGWAWRMPPGKQLQTKVSVKKGSRLISPDHGPQLNCL